jgi:hypothetical protein
MKKYLLIAGVLAVIAFASPAIVFAQPGAPSTIPKALTTTAFGNALDTVDNTEQHVTTPAEGKTTTWNIGLTAQVIVTKISGTVAGTLVLQGSMNGTDWTTIGSGASVTDASNTYTFNTVVKWYYYRISWTGTGTMSASFRNYFLWY